MPEFEKGILTLRQICHKLRFAFVALLTTALLVGPCLSFMGAFGISPAHAHSGMNHLLPHDVASGAGHDHHSADHSVHKMHSDAHGTPHHPAPLSCEEFCEGWALKKSPRVWATVSSDSDDSPPPFRLKLVKIDFLPPLQLASRQPQLVQWTVLPTYSPAYVLTGRYRL